MKFAASFKTLMAGMLFGGAAQAQEIVNVTFLGARDVNDKISLVNMQAPDGHKMKAYIGILNEQPALNQNESGKKVFYKAYRSEKDTAILYIDEISPLALMRSVNKTKKDITDADVTEADAWGWSVSTMYSRPTMEGDQTFRLSIPQENMREVFGSDFRPGQARQVSLEHMPKPK